MKPLASARSFVGSILVGCGLVLAGCATPKAASSPENAGAPELTNAFGSPQLYILASPHPRFYVEVDAVAGYAPSEAALQDLRDFLARYCSKPGGIEVVRSDVIPLETARGLPAKALARKYLNGPPENPAAPPPAFLYILFYDAAVCGKPVAAETGHPALRMARGQGAWTEKPRMDRLPYPAIFMNTRACGPPSIRSRILQHEAGHALGLAGRPTYAAGYHCLDNKCLMFKTLIGRVRLHRLLLGRNPLEFKQGQICQRCADQLAGNAKQAPPANLRFAGPVLVRSEAGYHVLSLPNRVKVVLGNLTDQDCRTFAASVRSEIPAWDGDDSYCRMEGQVKDQVLDDPAKMRELIDRAQADPLELVRKLAPKFWVARSARLCAKRQFAAAVEVCRQAVQSNPKDDLSFNLLAWIKATCADASVRDGQEAVSAATKACELTHWNEWNWIDTLAAAYAEAGDFERAIKFEEQAFRTGHPTESDRKDMRARISLYRQSRPFREKR
jgi:hypothetical protein